MKFVSASLIFISAFFALTACQKEEATSALAKHEKAYPDIRKKYVYQSILRLANIKRDENFEKLIKDVHKVIIYLPPSGDSTYQIKDLQSGMVGDGYEQLVDVRTANAQRISLWVKESKKQSHFVGLVDTDADDIILEIDGQLNLEYLSALASADQNSLMELLKGGF